MEFSIVIDQSFIVRHKMNLTEGALLGYLVKASNWAEVIDIDGDHFRFIARSKVCKDLPGVFSTKDYVYRAMKFLEEKGMILHKKVGRKDCIKLTEISQKWNTISDDSNSENFPSYDQTRKIFRPNSENFPSYEKTESPVKSGVRVSNSENFPTYHYISILNISCSSDLSENNPRILDEFFQKREWQNRLCMNLKSEGLIHDYEKDVLPIIGKFLNQKWEADDLKVPLNRLVNMAQNYVKAVLRSGGLKTENKKQNNSGTEIPVYLRKIS